MEIYQFDSLIKRFKDIHSKHYWPLCPECKKFIPYFNLWEKNNVIFLDVKCYYCKEKKKLNYYQLRTIKLEDYLKVVSDEKNIEYNSILKEKINEKIKSQQNKIGFCMDFHGWLDVNHYVVHEKMKFKTKHIICEKEIYLNSYCQLCKIKVGKFFCENCEFQLCKSCMNNHKKSCSSNIITLSNLHSLLNEKIHSYSYFSQLKKINNHYFNLIIDFFLLYYQIYLTTTNQHLNDYWMTMTLLNIQFEQYKENELFKSLLNKNSCSINYEFRDMFIKEKNAKITQIIDKGDGKSFFISLYKETSKSSMIFGKYYNDLFETTSIPIINVISFITIDEFLITLSSNCKNIYYITQKFTSKNIKHEDNVNFIANYIGYKFIGASHKEVFIYEFIPENKNEEPDINIIKKIPLNVEEMPLLKSQLDLNMNNINIDNSSNTPRRKNSNENTTIKKNYSLNIIPEDHITAIKFIEDPCLLKAKNDSYISALFVGMSNGMVRIFRKSKEDNFNHYYTINFETGEISNIFELSKNIIITSSNSSNKNLFIIDKKENLINYKEYNTLEEYKSLYSIEGIILIQSITNTIIITGSSIGLISIWNIYTNSLLYKFKNEDIKDNMTALCFLKNTQIIVSGYSKGQIVIWSIADHENLPIDN